MSHLLKAKLTSQPGLNLHRLRPRLTQAKITYNPTWRRIMASTTQPPWAQPQATSYSLSDLNLAPPLKVYNSLTRSKDTFIPEKSDVVTW